MRRLFVITVAALMMALPTAAAEPADGIFQLAQHIPADAAVFVALRTDDAYLDSLDTVLAQANTLMADLGTAGVNLNMRDIVANGLQIERADLDALLAWAGDMIGIAAMADGDGTPILMGLLQD